MRNLIIAQCLILVLLSVSCRKAKCINDFKDDIISDIHYPQVGCTGHSSGYGNYEWKFNSEAEFLSFSCRPSNIPIEFGFNGIIIAQGLRVPYVGPNGGDPGYDLDVELIQDKCDKEIGFHFILKTIDTSRVFEHMENVIVVLNGIDSTYKINYSHEIIPYKE
ncbi:MAG: hypothetical protein ACPG4Y_09995 [Chitinophagales bacterium]